IGEGFCLAASAVLEADDTPISVAVGAVRLPDDAFIDQNSGLVGHDLYLGLARAGAFKSKKVGKRIVAQWGNVRAALHETQADSTEATQDRDDLDDARRSLGFVSKSRA